MPLRYLNVLMFHSISDHPGPTSIPLDTFRRQLDVLVDLKFRSMNAAEFVQWHDGLQEFDERRVLITFDDGFQNFADHAWPELKARGLLAFVFLPTNWVGQYDGWESAKDHAVRSLMSWDTIRSLRDEGVEFGAHSIHHWNLNHLPRDVADREIAGSKAALLAELNQETFLFAPPFGAANRTVQDSIRLHYRRSFGTRLGWCSRRSPRFDLPRIEMHYFRDQRKWERHLHGGGVLRLAVRECVRTAKRFTGDCLRPHDQPSAQEILL